MKKSTATILSLILCFTMNAQQSEDMNLKGEKARIKQGVKSGEITKGEAVKISKEVRDVQRAKRRAKADGKITRKERRKIAKQDRQLDRTIYRTKHNDRDRK